MRRRAILIGIPTAPRGRPPSRRRCDLTTALSRRNFLTFDFGSPGRRGFSRGIAGEHCVTLHRTAMACRVDVTLSSEDSAGIAAARQALDLADQLEDVLTVFRETSEVARVNRLAAIQAVPVGVDVLDLLRTSCDLHAWTDGAFDVTAGPLTRCWGFLRREGRVPDAVELDAARAGVGMSHVQLDEPAATVRFDHADTELNFGGIGKGYVLDRMADFLERHGIRHARLSAGASSLRVLGGRDEGWTIDLRPRRASACVARLQLRDGAVGTSGAGEQFFEAGGVRYGHVIDPRSGMPASGVLAASVVTHSAAVADALSTAFLVGGAALAERYCAEHADTLAIVVPDAGLPLVFGAYRGATLDESHT